jgi:hypothetical protein
MSTSTQPESIPAAHPSRGIEWQYEPSEEEFIEAKALPGGLEDDALVGPIGAKAIASVTGAVSTALLSMFGSVARGISRQAANAFPVRNSDPFRCAENEATDSATFPDHHAKRHSFTDGHGMLPDRSFA